MGLAEFRQRHPWPVKYRALGRPREWLWSFDIPGTPEELWPYLTDTARTNRASGLGEMHYSERVAVGGVVRSYGVEILAQQKRRSPFLRQPEPGPIQRSRERFAVGA